MTDDGSMSILDHLDALRKSILRCCLALALGMAIAIPFIREILDFLFQPLRQLDIDPDTFLVVPQVMGGFKVAVSVTFWSGLLLASPFIVFFIAQFVFPGLHQHEKRIIRRSSWAAVLLFFGGAALGYFGTVHYALYNLLFAIHNYMGTTADWIFLTDYVMFVLKLVIGFGLAFQLPLVLLMIGYADLIEAGSLRSSRRQVLVGLLVLAMVLTPPEPVSQLMMGLTLYLLFEGCILLIARHERIQADIPSGS